MQNDFDGFSVYHCHPHAHGDLKLFRDNRDKQTYLQALAQTCLAGDNRLFFFDFIHTHCHFQLKVVWPTDARPSLDWLEKAVKSFLYRVHRLYGAYYRRRHNYVGPVFSREKSAFTPIPHKKAFLHAMKYIHHNATSINLFRVYEDDAFNSYNFYLATFVQNPALLHLSAPAKIMSSLDFLPVFDAIDFTLALKILDPRRSLKCTMTKFVEIHQRLLHERDAHYGHNRSREAYESKGVSALYDAPALLEIADLGGHQVTRFLRSIATYEITRENCEAHFRTFSAFFPWSNQPLKDSCRRIRRHFPLAFAKFVGSMKCKVSERAISELTGVSRDALRQIKRTDGPKFLP